jgi:iron-sulfur cluster assembly protein/iron-sulfur cluster insertion protein
MSDANEPVIALSANAAEHLQEMLRQDQQNAGKHLRVYVEAGGCSGMQYGMVFDEKREGDLSTEQFGVSVLVDGVSAKHLRGATLDYSDALNDGGFKLSNPNARQSCGCGKSFET